MAETPNQETDMEPITAIVTSLALGAGAIAGKDVVDAVVKDAYAGLKALVRGRYPRVAIEHLERAPGSKLDRVSIEDDLKASGAENDPELLIAALRLIELVQEQAPGVEGTIGVDLEDVAAANLCLSDVVASGTGVKVTRASFTGDINIKGVRAGVARELG
jgi:hypothetical protein